MTQVLQHAQSTEDSVPSLVDLTVVIPAHNSAAMIESTVHQLAEYLRGLRAEIIVVENGSTDDTGPRCHTLAAGWVVPHASLRVLHTDKGMGNALRTGALASHGSRVLLTADDLPFGFDDLDAASALGDAVPAMLIGSKAHPQSAVDRGRARAVLTGGFAILRRLVLGLRTGDPQGTILVDGDLLRGLARRLTEPGFLFTTELVYAVELAGIVPYEVPVRLCRAHDGHDTRIAVADVVSMATGLLRLRRRRAELAGGLQRALARVAVAGSNG